MDLFDGLHEALGAPEKRENPPDSFFTTPGMAGDEDLVALWRQDGWARYARGLFWTVDPREYLWLKDEWPSVPRDALVFARSAFGDLFLLDSDKVLQLDPQWNRLAKLGSSTYLFLNSTVKQPEFLQVILERDFFEQVRKRLGDLENDECYGLFPALPLGGNDEDPNAYRRVKLREYLAILAQAHG